MAIRETRKKVQRTIVHLTHDYPQKVALPELLQIRFTLDASIRSLCDHNEMIPRPNDTEHPWQCAVCGYVYTAAADVPTA